MTNDSPSQETAKWYAAKVFQNRTTPVANMLQQQGIKYFIPSKVIASLAFIKTTETSIQQLQEAHRREFWVYRNRGSKEPTAIPEHEMEVFMFVATAGAQGMIPLGEDKPEYHVGNRVRVKDGPFKGAEGHIKRIKKDRRLVVSIHGVVAIATTYIHPDLLEIIEN